MLNKVPVRERRFFGFSRNIIFTGITSFLTDTSVKMVYSVMPMFLMSIGATKTSLALIEGIAESTASLVKALSDRIGREKVLITGYLIYAMVYYGFGVTTKTGSIIALFAVYGLYSAATDGIQKAFISDMAGQNKKGTGLGIYNALLGITLLPASLIAGYFYDKINSSVPFYFGSAMALISAVMMLFFIILQNGKLQRADINQ